MKTGISARSAARFADFSVVPETVLALAAPAVWQRQRIGAGAVRGAGGSLQNKRIRESAYNPKRDTKQ